MGKDEIFSKIVSGAKRFPRGTYFRLSDAFGPGWHELDVATRRQAAKEVKISVAMREVGGFVFVQKNTRRTMVYKRI